MGNFSFEKLDVWQKAKDFTVTIYNVTSEFPDNEKYGLISQLRRAAVSLNSNIAEGSSRTTAKDQSRFYTMAYSSAIEVLNQLILCKELHFSELEHITAMLNRLHKSALES